MANPYESSRMVSEYLLFHYGRAEDILPYAFGPHESLHFAERAVTQTFDITSIPPNARALDLGCAVGRSSFALSNLATEVVGIDYSAPFIEAARALAQKGVLAYERLDEGDLRTTLQAEKPQPSRPERLHFETGDATCLREDLGEFDMVLLANLICRLPEPERLLERLPSLVRLSGQLVITSPYTWLDDFTTRPHWLGGFVDGDRPIFTIDTLTTALAPHFELEQTLELPFLIREHARKFQWSVAQATRWRRRDRTG